MLRQDGTIAIYRIQVQTTAQDGSLSWAYAYLGVLCPPGFRDEDPIFQQYGLNGTADLTEAEAGLRWLADRSPGKTFRLVRVEISQTTTPVGDTVTTQDAKTPGTFRLHSGRQVRLLFSEKEVWDALGRLPLGAIYEVYDHEGEMPLQFVPF